MIGKAISHYRILEKLGEREMGVVYEAEGCAFISMAYIDGERLKDKVARGPLGLEDAVEIAVHIAQGLQAAHEKGIVHRDIKTGNIMFPECRRLESEEPCRECCPGGR